MVSRQCPVRQYQRCRRFMPGKHLTAGVAPAVGDPRAGRHRARIRRSYAAPSRSVTGRRETMPIARRQGAY